VLLEMSLRLKKKKKKSQAGRASVISLPRATHQLEGEASAPTKLAPAGVPSAHRVPADGTNAQMWGPLSVWGTPLTPVAENVDPLSLFIPERSYLHRESAGKRMYTPGDSHFTTYGRLSALNAFQAAGWGFCLCY